MNQLLTFHRRAQRRITKESQNMVEVLSVVLSKEKETEKGHGNSLQTRNWRM